MALSGSARSTAVAKGERLGGSSMVSPEPIAVICAVEVSTRLLTVAQVSCPDIARNFCGAGNVIRSDGDASTWTDRERSRHTVEFEGRHQRPVELDLAER